MTVEGDLMARCRARGVELSVGPGGATLVWEAGAPPPADLLADLARHKADVLGLLARPRGLAPAWDPAEAERLLSHLRGELARLERAWPGGQFPPAKAGAVRIAAEVCETYALDHDLEAARGWNPLALLRAAVPWAVGLATPPTPAPGGTS
jgi:hypothetical protein